MTTPLVSSTRNIHQSRWKILRAALLGESIPPQDEQVSIHRFQGFSQSLLDAKTHTSFDDTTDVPTIHQVHVAIMALQCSLCAHIQKVRIHVNAPFETADLMSLREVLASKGITCRSQSTASSSSSPSSFSSTGSDLNVEWPPQEEYICQQYQLVSQNNISLLIRQPRKSRPPRKVPLTALVSQQYHNGVDNTGTTRIWDTELVLVHSLLTSNIVPAVKPISHVMELGAGMAGMAGLALAMTSTTPLHVTITDGHADCILHNQVHVWLNTFPTHVTIHVKQLVWTTTMPESGTMDLVLCSDGTHFQEHHASLAITIASVLQIGGVAILCQPPRGSSLSNFLKVLEAMQGLWTIQVLTDYNETLTRCHHHELTTNPLYDPNIHYPHIVKLNKRRMVTNEDRQQAVQQVDARTNQTIIQ